MKFKTIVFTVLAVSGAAFAGDGDLKPVKTELDKGPALLQPLATQNFRTVAADSGTVSDKARMAVFIIDGRFINVAIDASSAEATKPDCIRIDFTGKGDFTNAVVLPLEMKDADSNAPASFGPKVVDVKVGDQTVPVSIRGSYSKNGAIRRMELSLVTALEGECTFGDKSYLVRLYDGNANLLFGDKLEAVKQPSMPGGVFIRPGDLLVLDTGNGKFTNEASMISAGYGQPICMGDKMYKVVMSEDKLRLTAEALDTKPGKVTVEHADWSAVLVGNDNVLFLSGGDKPIAVPPDKYRVLDYIETKDKWKVLLARVAEEPKIFEVEPGGSLKLEIGSPLTVAANIAMRNGKLSIDSPQLLDSAGNSVAVYDPQGQKSEPTIEIYDDGGKRIHAARFQYG